MRMTTLEKKKMHDSYADFLQTFAWTHYVTFTTGYTLTLASARRLMENFHKQIKKAGASPFFWVAERFEVKDGYHTHALIKVPDAWHFKNIIDIWQKVSGGKKRGEWNRIDLQVYDPKKGAGFYVSKYVTKSGADYDLTY